MDATQPHHVVHARRRPEDAAKPGGWYVLLAIATIAVLALVVWLAAQRASAGRRHQGARPRPHRPDHGQSPTATLAQKGLTLDPTSPRPASSAQGHRHRPGPGPAAPRRAEHRRRRHRLQRPEPGHVPDVVGLTRPRRSTRSQRPGSPSGRWTPSVDDLPEDTVIVQRPADGDRRSTPGSHGRARACPRARSRCPNVIGKSEAQAQGRPRQRRLPGGRHRAGGRQRRRRHGARAEPGRRHAAGRRQDGDHHRGKAPPPPPSSPRRPARASPPARRPVRYDDVAPGQRRFVRSARPRFVRSAGQSAGAGGRPRRARRSAGAVDDRREAGGAGVRRRGRRRRPASWRAAGGRPR